MSSWYRAAVRPPINTSLSCQRHLPLVGMSVTENGPISTHCKPHVKVRSWAWAHLLRVWTDACHRSTTTGRRTASTPTNVSVLHPPRLPSPLRLRSSASPRSHERVAFSHPLLSLSALHSRFLHGLSWLGSSSLVSADTRCLEGPQSIYPAVNTCAWDLSWT